MSERRIYLVRHGIAEDAAESGRDRDRALTPQGRGRLRREAAGLRRMGVRAGVLATSPARRARETAELLRNALPEARVEVWPELAPGVDERLLCARLERRESGADVVLVGHQPDLGEILAYLLTGSRGSFATRFRKGAVACLRAPSHRAPGRAVLEWLVTAGQLEAAAAGGAGSAKGEAVRE